MNVSELNRFEEGTVVDPVALIEAGVLKNVRDGVRILGNGEITKSLTVIANGFTKSAARKNYCCWRKSRGGISAFSSVQYTKDY